MCRKVKRNNLASSSLASAVAQEATAMLVRLIFSHHAAAGIGNGHQHRIHVQLRVPRIAQAVDGRGTATYCRRWWDSNPSGP